MPCARVCVLTRRWDRCTLLYRACAGRAWTMEVTTKTASTLSATTKRDMTCEPHSLAAANALRHCQPECWPRFELPGVSSINTWLNQTLSVMPTLLCCRAGFDRFGFDKAGFDRSGFNAKVRHQSRPCGHTYCSTHQARNTPCVAVPRALNTCLFGSW